MDKNAIKKYAVWARNELIARVTQKAEQYEITEKKITPKDADSINGRLLTTTEKNQRKALIEKIQADGFEQVMEEVAYTWFNRFTALRFMEVNNYLPSHIRVFTNEAGEFKPQILADAIQLDLEGLDMDKVFELKDANKTEELYKYLLITQCNALSAVLPRMFQKIEHYTELLLPDYLLREGSVIEQMIALLPEEDWTDQIQIIGWLYQYYNSEPKDAVFAALKKNVKISKENIPAATQLFTPDWIVRYMVENSLGRLWLEGHPNDVLKTEWKYYLDETEQEADVQKQLEAIRKEYANLKPEDIRCIDPCMGSGHILCYMFDVLVKIYEDYGYTAREAAENIVEKNLWGLDIDERAAQLSYFAVMMKARQYDRRFLTRGIQPHVYAIEESNGITSAPMHDMGIELSQEEYGKAAKEAMRLVEEMHDAKEYGSIIQVTPCDWELLRRFAIPRGHGEDQMRMDIHGEIEASARLQALIDIGEALSQSYHAVITNPPYMSLGNAAGKLSEYVKKKYSSTKTDMFSVLIDRCRCFADIKGYLSLITQQSFFFLSRLSEFREDIITNNTMVNAVHMGLGAFGNDFGTVAFTIAKRSLKGYISSYVYLGDKKIPEEKRDLLLSQKAPLYKHAAEEFLRLPNATYSYTISKHTIDLFGGEVLADSFVSGGRNKTHNDDTYIRLQWEVDATSKKWTPYGKGGEFRRWYGDIYYVVDWSEPAKKFYASHGGLCNERFWGKEGITWSFVTSYKPSFRYKPADMIYSSVSPTIFRKDFANDYYIMGLLNSNVGLHILNIISSTIGTNVGEVLQFPVIRKEDDVERIVQENIDISKSDWDSFETSWDFKEHPFITYVRSAQESSSSKYIKKAYAQWEQDTERRFLKLKANEEKLNEIFINAYGLKEEISASVEEKDVTVHKADYEADIKSFISYAVGCMFGRYSLDISGLAYAGGEWNELKYKTFIPDKDAIIPICDDEYFEDDIVGRLIDFIECTFGKDTLEENLQFIAGALGGKGSPRDCIRNYFLNNFYPDHIKMYQKRPIYWLFDSGKKNGFKCLIYMHRYQADTIARIRTDYVHEQQSRYRTAIDNIEQRISLAATSERVRLNKKLSSLQAQAAEIREYEERIHHLADQMIPIDLDNGVKNNYELFKDVLAKIK